MTESELDSSTTPQLDDCCSLVMRACVCARVLYVCVRLYMCTAQQAGAADVRHTHTHTNTHIMLLKSTEQQQQPGRLSQ